MELFHIINSVILQTTRLIRNKRMRFISLFSKLLNITSRPHLLQICQYRYEYILYRNCARVDIRINYVSSSIAKNRLFLRLNIIGLQLF